MFQNCDEIFIFCCGMSNKFILHIIIKAQKCRNKMLLWFPLLHGRNVARKLNCKCKCMHACRQSKVLQWKRKQILNSHRSFGSVLHLARTRTAGITFFEQTTFSERSWQFSYLFNGQNSVSNKIIKIFNFVSVKKTEFKKKTEKWKTTKR